MEGFAAFQSVDDEVSQHDDYSPVQASGWELFFRGMTDKGVTDVNVIRGHWLNLTDNQRNAIENKAKNKDYNASPSLMRPKISCEFGCGLVFSTTDKFDMDEHMLRYCPRRTDAKPKRKLKHKVECTYCGKILSSVQSLRGHISKKHRYLKHCRQVMQNLETESQQRSIFVESESALPIECSVCQKRFITEAGLSKHMKRFHTQSQRGPQEDVECPHCGKKCPDKRSLSRHVEISHPPLENNPESAFNGQEQIAAFGLFQCEDCGQELKTIGAIRRHYKFEHSKTLTPNELLELHVGIETSKIEDDKPQRLVDPRTIRKKATEKRACAVCGLVLENSTRVARHMQQKHGLYTPAASAADQHATRARRAREKKRIKRSCNLCRKSFVTDIALLNHYHIGHKITTAFGEDVFDNSRRTRLASLGATGGDIFVDTEDAPFHGDKNLMFPAPPLSSHIASKAGVDGEAMDCPVSGSLEDLISMGGGGSGGSYHCQVCFASYQYWAALQQHYATAHELNVISHVEDGIES